MADSEQNESREDLLKLEEEISNFFEDMRYDWGGSPLLGRIYALCVLATPEKPLFQKDLVEQFNVNPSTISRNLKELENWRLLDRRREPGSREWKYQVDASSFLELLIHRFDETATNIRDRIDALNRIRNRWGESLSDLSKDSMKGKRTLAVLDRLIDWIAIVEHELDSFIQNLHQKYLELERKFEHI